MLKRFTLFLLAGAGVAFSAGADAPDINDAISAYNEAVSSGTAEVRAAAALQLGEAIMAHPERGDAALLAYEAGQTLCVYADCQGASPIAEFALGKPLIGDAVLPGDVRLLADYAAWKASPRSKTRKALDGTLAGQINSGASMLTLAAFQNRYVADYSKGKWREAAHSADEAARHFEPFRNVVGQQWSDARIAALTASFNSDPDKDDALGMARHHVDLSRMAADTGDDAPAWLETHRYLSDAWQMAMTAYFKSKAGYGRVSSTSPDRVQRDIDEILAERDTFNRARPATEESGGEDSDLPFCDGSFDMKPALEYPDGAADNGMYGAVIVRLSIADLKVSDAEVLAAVPSQTFEETAEKTIRQWSWKVKDGVPGETCRTGRSNIIQSMVFQLGR